MSKRPLLIAALLAALAAPAWACETGVKHDHPKPAKLSTAQVREVDAAQATVTLYHAAIGKAGVPESTLVYRAARPAQVKGLKAGDTVRYRAEELAGTLTVTEIRKVSRR